jgi:hypothetical protein
LKNQLLLLEPYLLPLAPPQLLHLLLLLPHPQRLHLRRVDLAKSKHHLYIRPRLFSSGLFYQLPYFYLSELPQCGISNKMFFQNLDE